jgi:DNA-binding NtrC family response regulator
MLGMTDTGCGMTAEVMEHVFEPFFTTKPEGQGTGLGLSMVYGFVKQSDGHINIYSEVGHGTTIRIYLPRIGQAEDVATELDAGPVAGGTETILVAEDDEEVRRTVGEMLTDLGYRVLKARDAQSALAIIESGAAIDMLFTDVVMPGTLRSPELARQARERLPEIAVLFTSGYTDNAIVHGGRLDRGIELLSKPYTREALGRKIRHVLRNQRQRHPGTAAPPPAGDAAGDARPTRALTVLVVEDDALIRLATADMLHDLGHRALEAGNAQAALAILDRRPVDLMLTDLGLPGTSGDALAAAALQRLPGLRIIVASGQDALPSTTDDTVRNRAILLQKPYDLNALAVALAGAMS